LGAGCGFALVWTYGLWGLLSGWIAGTCVALVRMRLAAPEAPLVPAHPRAGLALTGLGFPIFAFYGVSLVLRSVDPPLEAAAGRTVAGGVGRVAARAPPVLFPGAGAERSLISRGPATWKHDGGGPNWRRKGRRGGKSAQPAAHPGPPPLPPRGAVSRRPVLAGCTCFAAPPSSLPHLLVAAP